ncbi:MAG: peptidoglycan DD-metalloendopeptidase family protein [Hyphomicrobiales bacterium]
MAAILALPFGAPATLAQEPAGMAGMGGAGARPEAGAATETTGNPADRLTVEKQSAEGELEKAAAALAASEERQKALSAEIAALDNDRARINAELIGTARKAQEAEEAISATERRLQTLAVNEKDIRASLAERRGVLAELLAALQRIGRKPPPALVARPDDALGAVRSAILLGAVLPELRIEADALAADLAELVLLEKKMTDERDRMKAEVGTLAAEREKLTRLIEEKKKGGEVSQASLTSERDTASELAGKVTSLQELIGKLETDIAAARGAAEAAAKADARVAADKAEGRQRVASLQDTGRIAPAMAFEDARGIAPLPVKGIIVREYGAPDGIGGEAKGRSIATRAGARVVAPADCWVVYAGPFRSYGELLILNAGGGYHIVLAGMDRIDVELGQFVLAGEPVAVMGTRKLASATAVDILSSQPVLYVEFRKDGTAIDPAPWWAGTTDEKARG